MAEPITATIAIGTIVLGAFGNALYEVAKGTGKVGLEKFRAPRKLYESLTEQQRKRLESALADPSEKYQSDGSADSLAEIGRALQTILQKDEQLASCIQGILTDNIDDLKATMGAGFEQLKVGQGGLKQLISDKADEIKLVLHEKLTQVTIDQHMIFTWLNTVITQASDVLTLEVGPAIGKAILKHWLTDSTFLAEASTGLVDVFKQLNVDTLAQRRAERQFDAIGERVGESLLPLFEAEGIRLGDRNAVAFALAETLNTTPIDAAILAERNLDPKRLTDYLLEARPEATHDFSEAAIALYRRMLSECSQSIVDIASQLPSFTEITFSEILEREHQLLGIANQILKEVHRIRGTGDSEAETQRFETEYRRAVIRNLDNIELFGADVSQASRRHRLSVAYVTLSVEQPVRNASVRNHAAEEYVTGQVIVQVHEAIAQARCVLIRGLAGSGKTTLLKWVAVGAASRNLPRTLADWNNVVPFFIRLRDFVDKTLPSPQDFPCLISRTLKDDVPTKWVSTKLESGRAIVLIDGVDEIPESQRTPVREWLVDIVGRFDKARFVVTSRPHAVEAGWLADNEFADAELQPMERQDVDGFIDHWHNAVGEALQDEAEKSELPELASNLKATVRSTRAIRLLATNPLLCAMLCALHRDRNRQLPSDRIQLYNACCEMLLERRDLERGVALQNYPELTLRQKRALLEDLAYWFLDNNWSTSPLDHVEERLRWKMQNMQNLPTGVTANGILRLFIARSGIVREPVVGQVDFAHRTFLEFLAAHEVVAQGNFGVLTENSENDQWRETIIVAAGIARQPERENLLQALIARGDNEEEKRHRLHMLAVSCLETSIELTADVTTEIQDRMDTLVPPKDMTDATALASAGELAVPYLGYQREYDAKTAAACVHTLGLIGDEAALEMLKGYTEDVRMEVVDEFVKSVESEDYTRLLLPHKEQRVSEYLSSSDKSDILSRVWKHLSPADEFLSQMELFARPLIGGYSKVQALLQWADAITANSGGEYLPAAKRAYALRQFIGLDFDLYQSLDLNFDLNLDRSLHLDLDFYQSLDQSLDLYFDLYLYLDFDLYLYLDFDLYLYLNLDRSLHLDLYLYLDRKINIISRFDSLGVFKGGSFDGLIAELNALKARLAQAKREKRKLDEGVLEAVREAWISALKLTPEMLTLSSDEHEALGRYLKAIRLVADSKKAATRVTPAGWQKIADRLLRVVDA